MVLFNPKDGSYPVWSLRWDSKWKYIGLCGGQTFGKNSPCSLVLLTILAAQLLVIQPVQGASILTHLFELLPTASWVLATVTWRGHTWWLGLEGALLSSNVWSSFDKWIIILSCNNFFTCKKDWMHLWITFVVTGVLLIIGQSIFHTGLWCYKTATQCFLTQRA